MSDILGPSPCKFRNSCKLYQEHHLLDTQSSKKTCKKKISSFIVDSESNPSAHSDSKFK